MLDTFNKPEFVVFTTRDYANVSGISLSAASKRLHRLAAKNALTSVTKGIWANTSHPHFHPLACVPYLLGNEQGYVSFLTALHLHGVISQIPKTIQVATTGRGRELQSPVGQIEFFQIKPELMREGANWSDSHLPYLVATPEKALIDTFYIATRKNRRFASLPELDLALIDKKVFERLLLELPIPSRIRSAMRSQWQRSIGDIAA